MKQSKRIIVLLLALALFLPAAVPVQAADIALTITGDGVEKETVFTLAELKAMTVLRNAYSAWNTWPAKSTYYAEGVAIAALLEKAGLRSNATTINIAEAPAADGSIGYNMTFLMDDLLAERYTFDGTKKAVPAIVATKLGEKSFDSMDEIDLRLIYGQLDAQEQTTIGFVKSISVITVTCDPVRQLPKPIAAAEIQSNGQYSVSLTTSNVNAKIYYTTDGSTPTVHSAMYNISAPHWQPHLNVPITASANTSIKAIAVATGFADSEVLSFTPANPSGETQPTENPLSGKGMANFAKSGVYQSGQFSDVEASQWFGSVVTSVFEYGLMRGTSADTFNPSGNVTLAEAITIAARVHSIFTTGSENTATGNPNPWYQANVDYAIANGIIASSDFLIYTRAATRAEMIYIFSRALPQSEFKEQNKVNSLPDVGSGTPYYDSIFMLYKAGILTGNDAQGTFNPDRGISRAEAAAIISRVILPDTRVSGRTY